MKEFFKILQRNPIDHYVEEDGKIHLFFLNTPPGETKNFSKTQGMLAHGIQQFVSEEIRRSGLSGVTAVLQPVPFQSTPRPQYLVFEASPDGQTAHFNALRAWLKRKKVRNLNPIQSLMMIKQLMTSPSKS